MTGFIPSVKREIGILGIRGALGAERVLAAFGVVTSLPSGYELAAWSRPSSSA